MGAALEEAEGALEAEENKVLRAQLELGQVKTEIDRRIAEKEEEFNNTRKNHGRAMESLQASLESEQRAKAEGLRIKKKLESDINEFEILWTTPTRPTTRLSSPSRDTRVSSVRLSASMRRPAV